MPLEEIMRLLEARNFTPFRIHVSDGASYDVHQRWQVLPLARCILVGFPGVGLPSMVAADYVNIALVHITRLEPISATAGGNGQT